MANFPPIIHESWHEHLDKLFDDPKMALLKDEIIPAKKFYPESRDIFRVFSMPFDQIKVVILGQDPYPNEGQANGLAFAVNPNVGMPKSLQIIKNEVMDNMAINTQGALFDYAEKHPDWRTLRHWHNQGVFLLNSALTVEAGNAASHITCWNWFTRDVITIISKKVRPVWLLWGGKAQGFKDYIYNGLEYHDGSDYSNEIILSKADFILKAYHPAAEAYDPTRKERFTGCRHFYLTNKILSLKQTKMIDW